MVAAKWPWSHPAERALRRQLAPLVGPSTCPQQAKGFLPRPRLHDTAMACNRRKQQARGLECSSPWGVGGGAAERDGGGVRSPKGERAREVPEQ